MNGFTHYRLPISATAFADGQANQVTTALAVVDRVKQAIIEELETISRRRPVDYDAFSARKNMGLLELNRLAPIIAKNLANPTLSRSLSSLVETLEASKKALAIQLEAARTIAEMVASAVQYGESDGTYSSNAGIRGLYK